VTRHPKSGGLRKSTAAAALGFGETFVPHKHALLLVHRGHEGASSTLPVLVHLQLDRGWSSRNYAIMCPLTGYQRRNLKSNIQLQHRLIADFLVPLCVCVCDRSVSLSTAVLSCRQTLTPFQDMLVGVRFAYAGVRGMHVDV
jgi:hypothetical protein